MHIMIEYVIKRTVLILKKLTIIISVSSFIVTGALSALIGVSVWANRPRGVRIPIETA